MYCWNNQAGSDLEDPSLKTSTHTLEGAIQATKSVGGGINSPTRHKAFEL